MNIVWIRFLIGSHFHQNCEMKSGALPGDAGAFDSHGSPHQLAQLFADRQTKACSTKAPGGGGV